ncbi:MAG: Maf family protein [Deltaproteobacteria bacterium]|nr:Maf family protein [Deltaproteobacteria bacterium]
MEYYKKPVILASSSERRIFLLKQLDAGFIVVNHRLQVEPQFDGSVPLGHFVQDLALKKAESLQEDYPGNFIIGSDTVICLNGTVYGKPKDFDDAFNTIKELSGKTHEVYTGVSLFNKLKNVYRTAYDKTFVKVKPLNNNEIKNYLNKYPPFDKAGSYGIQDDNGIVESYAGSFENVLGLPVQKLIPLLNEYHLI